MIDYSQKYFNYLGKMDQTARKTMIALELEGDKFVVRLHKKSSAEGTTNIKKPVKKAKSVEKLKKESEDDW